MGCGGSKVKKASPKADDGKTEPSSAASHDGSGAHRERSRLSRLPADSENSLAACAGHSDDGDTDSTGHRRDHRRSSASSMPESPRTVAQDDHFAPIDLPPALMPPAQGGARDASRASSTGLKPFNTALEEHEKTDSAQAEQEYRRVLEKKREAHSIEAAQREMDEFDPIRPMDSFNVTHRGLLGRCWDRRAAELVPIAFLHALDTDTAGVYANELVREGTVNAADLVCKELRVPGSGESASDGSPHSPEGTYPGVFPSRDWSALRRRRAQRSSSGGDAHASHSSPSHSPTASMSTNHAGVPRRSHWFSVCGVASQTGPWRPSAAVAGSGGGAGGTRNDEDTAPGAVPPPEVLMALPLQARIESYSAYLTLHERFTGVKSAFAFTLSDQVDDEPDTQFLRDRRLSPAKGVYVVRWNRVEFMNPSLRTLTLAAMDASLGRYETRDQAAQMTSVAATGGSAIEAELHAMGNAMFVDGNVSFGQHLLADIKNRSFVDGLAGGRLGNGSIIRSHTANSSFMLASTTTLAEGKTHITEGGKRTEFPEESVLCLAMAVPTSRLFWGNQFRQRTPAAREEGDAGGSTSVSVDALRVKSTTASQGGKGSPARTKATAPTEASAGVRRLVATPVTSGAPKSFPTHTAASSHGGSSPTARASVTSPTSVASGAPPAAAMTHLVAFNISSFSVSMDPFRWEALNYTRCPVDVDVTKSSSRRQYGEGVITDIMYGGTLVIECSSPEAGVELERMLDTVVWSESRNIRAIAQGVHKRMKARLAERAAALRRRKAADQKEKEKSKGKAKGSTPEEGIKSSSAVSGYTYRIMRRIGGRPIRDAVELKHIAVYLGEQGVHEAVLSGPDGCGGGSAAGPFSPAAGAAGGAEITPSFSRVASAWTGLETMTAVIETWGLHLLANPHFAQPTSLYLQKFSGLVPVLLHTSLVPLTQGISASTTDLGEEAEEDRFFAPELEPLSAPPCTADAGVATVAKRIPKYNRFYASLPSTPTSQGQSMALDGSGRTGWGGPPPPPRRRPSSLNTAQGPPNDNAGGVGAFASENDPRATSGLGDVGASTAANSRSRDPMALSRTMIGPRGGLPMTLSCETMPGTTNFSLPPSDLDEDGDEDDDPSITQPMRAERPPTPGPPDRPSRVEATAGVSSGAASRTATHTVLSSSSSTIVTSEATRGGGGGGGNNARDSQFWTSGMYPTEDSLVLSQARAPTLIFSASGSANNSISAPPASSQTTRPASRDGAKPPVAQGSRVRPSRIIVKRRPSDDAATADGGGGASQSSDSVSPLAVARQSTNASGGPSLVNPFESSLVRAGSSTVTTEAVSAVNVNATDAEERWSMAMLEARALLAELEDMQEAVRAAQEALMVKEEEQRTLFRSFLPFTSLNKLDAMFLYLKTAIHEPDDLPHGCLYLDTPDWLSVLYAVWTSPRNHVCGVSIVYELMCKDIPKLGVLAGLLYYENSTAGLDKLTLNASKLFGTGMPTQPGKGNAGACDFDASSRDGQGLPSHDSLYTAGRGATDAELGSEARVETGKKGKISRSWFRRRQQVRQRDPATVGSAAMNSHEEEEEDDDVAEERDAQRYQHYFLTHPQAGGPQMLHYGFGIITPLYYVTAEQARDTLWWLLCAIAENARCAENGQALVHRQGSPGPQSAEGSNAFTLRLAGLPREKARYLAPKSRSLSSFFHLNHAAKDNKSVGHREWVDEDAMQLNSFLILSESPSGFVFEDTPGSPLAFGRSVSSFSPDVELSADPRKRHKKGGSKEAPLPMSHASSGYPLYQGSLTADPSSNATFACHEHNYGKRAWMHAEAKAEIRPFCHVLYHSCLATASAIEDERERLASGEDLESLSAPRVSHYHLPFNRVHNHAQYYLSPERRLDLLRVAARASHGGDGLRAVDGSPTPAACTDELEKLLSATPANPFVFGLQSEEEEKSVLLEEEGRLFRHAEDIWEVLRRSVNKYNKSMVVRMGKGEASDLDDLGLVKRPIVLER